MSDIITRPGFYRQNSGQKAEIVFERDGYWYGREVRTAISGNARRWKPDGYCQTTALHEDGIAGPWIDPSAFSVGDLVLVDCEEAPAVHQHYGTVRYAPSDATCTYGVELNSGAILWFPPHELKPVTLPAPLPAGYRLKPRNVTVQAGDYGCNGRTCRYWKPVPVPGPWVGSCAEDQDKKFPDCAPYFFIEPIPTEPPPTFLEAVEKEAARAVELHGEFNSLHEAYGVLMEEVDEFWEHVRKQSSKRIAQDVYNELVQIAACCVKAAHLVKRSQS